MLSLICVVTPLFLGQPAAPSTPPGPIDYSSSATIADARSAINILRAADRVHSGPAAACTAVYEGTAAIEGHMMRPGMVRSTRVRFDFAVDGDRLSLKEISGPGGARIETTLVLRGRVAQQPAADAPFAECGPTESPAAAADAARWLPGTVVRAALQAAPSCRTGQAVEFEGQTCRTVTFADAAARACTLLIDAKGRVVRIESLAADQRLGDVCNWTRFDGWEERAGEQVPARITRFVVLPGLTIRYDLSLAAFSAGEVSPAAFRLPPDRGADIPTWDAAEPAGAGLEFVAVGPSVWSVEVAAADTRAMVIERAADLVVLDAPDGDEVCTRILAALRERFPGKPVAIVAFGHHHPSPSGGLRAFAAAGATILCPRRLEDHVRAQLSRPTTLGPPAIAGPAEPRLSLFDGGTTIECGEWSVRLINIDERSAHAFSYMVFYFPDIGLIFEDDLGYFPAAGAARVTPRLMGLVDELEALGIRPTRLIQAWPVKGAVREVEWATVAGLVRAERERAQAK